MLTAGEFWQQCEYSLWGFISYDRRTLHSRDCQIEWGHETFPATWEHQTSSFRIVLPDGETIKARQIIDADEPDWYETSFGTDHKYEWVIEPSPAWKAKLKLMLPCL